MSYSRELSNLVKIYINDAKYTGHNDNFIFKLAIIYDIYSRADIPPKAKINVFTTIFKGLALDYYYSNITTSAVTLNFDQVCNLIRNYF